MLDASAGFCWSSSGLGQIEVIANIKSSRYWSRSTNVAIFLPYPCRNAKDMFVPCMHENGPVSFVLKLDILD